jgi:peptidyl-prolyl cis-trans isomerase-like 1
MDKLKKIFKHDKEPEHASTTTATSSTPSQTTSASAAQPATSSDGTAATSGLPAGVLLTTNYGDITIALYSDKTPKVRLACVTHASPTI